MSQYHPYLIPSVHPALQAALGAVPQRPVLTPAGLAAVHRHAAAARARHCRRDRLLEVVDMTQGTVGRHHGSEIFENPALAQSPKLQRTLLLYLEDTGCPVDWPGVEVKKDKKIKLRPNSSLSWP